MDANENDEYSSDSGKEAEEQLDFPLQNLDYIRPSSRSIFGLPDEPSQILRPKLNDRMARLSVSQTHAIIRSKNDSLSPIKRTHGSLKK